MLVGSGSAWSGERGMTPVRTPAQAKQGEACAPAHQEVGDVVTDCRCGLDAFRYHRPSPEVQVVMTRVRESFQAMASLLDGAILDNRRILAGVYGVEESAMWAMKALNPHRPWRGRGAGPATRKGLGMPTARNIVTDALDLIMVNAAAGAVYCVLPPAGPVDSV